MALLTIFKEHKLLLGATAVLSVGSVAAAWAAGGDQDYLEISLRGTWISDPLITDQGIFVTSLYPMLEFLLVKLWQEQGIEVVRS